MNFDIRKEWNLKPRNWGNQIHRTCSYIAMFSPRIIHCLIKEYSKENELVVDNFSGRGTTLLESRILKRNFIGTDLNPLAYVLSKSKSIALKPTQIYQLLDSLESNYHQWELKNKYIYLDETLLIYYSSYNLKQLYYLKEVLGNKWKSIDDEKIFLLSIILGLMHGPSRSKGMNSSYFSLHMSNTISMSPNYVKNYSIKHNLIKFEFNLFTKIREKLEKVFKKTNFKELKTNLKSDMYLADALNIKNYLNNQKVDLFITSPPYLNIINYTNQNWIKLWMLGYERTELKDKIKLDDNLNLIQYESFIKRYLSEIVKLSHQNTKIILIIGDVSQKDKIISFIDLWDNFKNEIPLILEEVIDDNIEQNKKATNSLGSKKGKSTAKDKIYIFKLKT